MKPALILALVCAALVGRTLAASADAQFCTASDGSRWTIDSAQCQQMLHEQHVDAAKRAAAARAATLPQVAGDVMVPLAGGTSIPWSVAAEVTSANAQPGTEVAIFCDVDVMNQTNSYVLVKKGARGFATVQNVVGAGSNGSGGAVSLSPEYVFDVWGEKVALVQTTVTSKDADRKGEASTMAIIGWATFGLGGIFAHNMTRGRNGSIEPAQVFAGVTDHTVLVEVNPKTAATGYAKS